MAEDATQKADAPPRPGSSTANGPLGSGPLNTSPLHRSLPHNGAPAASPASGGTPVALKTRPALTPVPASGPAADAAPHNSQAQNNQAQNAQGPNGQAAAQGQNAQGPGEPVQPGPRRRERRPHALNGPLNAGPLNAGSGTAAPAAAQLVPHPVEETEKGKVVHIIRRLQEEASQKRAQKQPWVLISVLAAIALPTLLVALYFVFFAADRYVAEARFAIRSNEAQGADVLGMISGMPASTITSDSYIVTDYVHSREMVELLESRIGLRKIYSHPEADFLTRLDPAVTLEGLIAYWKKRVDIYYDSTKNTIAVEVQAFAAADARRLADEIVVIVRALVNELSAQSRRDAVQFAASEVARAELRVRGARAEMLAFRTENNEFDPTATAAATLALTSQLETERAQLNSQLAAVSGYLSASAPSVQMLKSRITALGDEIARVQNQISSAGNGIAADAGGTGLRGGQSPAAATRDTSPDTRIGAPQTGQAQGGASAGALASVVGRYQEILLSQEFAETAYAAAQASLERARMEADRTQSYLAIYVHPDLAETAAYPRRLMNVLVVLVISAILWAIGALAALTIRDHMP